MDMLNALESAKPRQRRALIATAENELIHKICELVLNVLNGNVALSESETSKLKRYKKVLRQLIDKRVKVRQKRQLLVQKGGFLSAIIGPALAELSIYNALR